MINGTHVIIYTRDAAADRAFIRDSLGFPGVDAGDGWLIFRLPPAEIAVHPTDGEPKHELYLMCEDIASTLQELAAQGVEPTHPISDEGWGCSPRSACRAGPTSGSTSPAIQWPTT